MKKIKILETFYRFYKILYLTSLKLSVLVIFGKSSNWVGRVFI